MGLKALISSSFSEEVGENLRLRMEFIKSSSLSRMGNSERDESKEEDEFLGELGGTSKYSRVLCGLGLKDVGNFCRESWAHNFIRLIRSKRDS